MRLSRLAACGAAAVITLSVSAVGAAASEAKRMKPDGSGYCLSIRFEQRGSYLYAIWANACSMDIYVDYRRIKPETGEQVNDTIRIGAESTVEENMYHSREISWSEVF